MWLLGGIIIVAIGLSILAAIGNGVRAFLYLLFGEELGQAILTFLGVMALVVWIFAVGIFIFDQFGPWWVAAYVVLLGLIYYRSGQ